MMLRSLLQKGTKSLMLSTREVEVTNTTSKIMLNNVKIMIMLNLTAMLTYYRPI